MIKEHSTNTIGITQHISILFAAYGRGDDIIRAKSYIDDLKDLPSELVGKSCKYLRYTSKYLPSISEIVDTCRQIFQIDNNSVKSWPDALLDIKKQTQLCGVYQKPKFATYEIAKAIDTYGWYNWCITPDNQMTYAQAQLHKIYELICQDAIKYRTQNYVLTKNPLLLLGCTEDADDNMSCISETIQKIKEANTYD